MSLPAPKKGQVVVCGDGEDLPQEVSTPYWEDEYAKDPIQSELVKQWEDALKLRKVRGGDGGESKGAHTKDPMQSDLERQWKAARERLDEYAKDPIQRVLVKQWGAKIHKNASDQPPSPPLSLELSKHYREEGYVKASIQLNLAKRLSVAMDKLLPTLRASKSVFVENKTTHIKQVQRWHRRGIPEIKELVDFVAPIAQQLTGCTEFTLLNVQLFVKHPQVSKPTRAHQDNAYFKLDPPIAVTFWVPLDDIDEENGALYYAPKSHLTPTRLHARYHKSTTFRIRSGLPGLASVPTRAPFPQGRHGACEAWRHAPPQQ